MIRAFIIEYDFNGKKEFANVVEYKHTPADFYISPIATDYNTQKLIIILRLVNGKLFPTEHSAPVNETLLNALQDAIGKFL
jgi:hypothetical protein